MSDCKCLIAHMQAIAPWTCPCECHNKPTSAYDDWTCEECGTHFKDGVPVEENELIEELQKAVGSFIWLGNNLHNIIEDPTRFKDLYEAALEDAKKAYDKVEQWTR